MTYDHIQLSWKLREELSWLRSPDLAVAEKERVARPLIASFESPRRPPGEAASGDLQENE